MPMVSAKGWSSRTARGLTNLYMWVLLWPVVVVETFVVCPEARLAFYHVPKCGGLSVTVALVKTGHCRKAGWGITPAYNRTAPTSGNRSSSGMGQKSEVVEFDSAHVTPSELGR